MRTRIFFPKQECNLVTVIVHWRIEGGAKGALAPPPKIG